MSPRRSDPPEAATLAADVRGGNRAALGRALTLVESRHPDHRQAADALFATLGPASADAVRVGISGLPGAGKSTLIELLGMRWVEEGKRVAVAAVDPTSQLTGGSILGDKTRMTALSRDPRAFVRPSPSGGARGGVAGRTREAVALFEAAGFDVVVVETVGVGQSEGAVADLVDTFVVVLTPAGGDDLQGIKRGILERADVVVVNKADGDLEAAAEAAGAELATALELLRGGGDGWAPPVLVASARTGRGVEEVAAAIAAHRRWLETTGALTERRREQRLQWMRERLEEGLLAALRSSPSVSRELQRLETEVSAGDLSPVAAADELLAAFLSSLDKRPPMA